MALTIFVSSHYFIFSLLITFIGTGDPLEWRGYLYVSLLFVVSLIRTIILHQYLHSCFVTGMHLRTAVIGAIYKKVRFLSFSNVSVQPK